MLPKRVSSSWVGATNASCSARVRLVSIGPGQIALTRIPSGPTSIASALVIWFMPPLVMPYTTPPKPTSPETELVLTMTPPPPCSWNAATATLAP